MSGAPPVRMSWMTGRTRFSRSPIQPWLQSLQGPFIGACEGLGTVALMLVTVFPVNELRRALTI